MWLVELEHVGAVTYGRLQRDGAIRTLIPGVALPHDVPDSPGLRRHVLQRRVPAGCQVTGLGALWVAGLAPAPVALDVRTPLGRHVRNWHTGLPLIFHAVGLVAETTTPRCAAGVGFTDIATASADTLRWAPLEHAVPAAMSVLGSYEGQERMQFADAVVTQIRHEARALSAWQAVVSVLNDAQRDRAGAAS